MQLSIQAHAQQRVEQMVRQWSEKSGVSIGKIRYHLLRNGLIVQHIHIQRQHDQINIQQLLVKAGPEQLADISPHIGKIDIFGLDAELTYGKHILQNHDKQWQQLWQSTTDIRVHNGTLKLYLDHQATDHHASTALRMHNIHYQQQQHQGKRIITASAQTQQGNIHMQGQIDKSNRANAALHWQHLNARNLAHASALQAIQGWVDGQIFWQQSPDKPVHMHGSIAFSKHAPGTQPSQLRFTATQGNDNWDIDWHASAWPLAPWSATLPMIGQQRLQAGNFDGSSHWQGHAGAWHITSPHGSIHNATFTASINNDDQAQSWHAKQLQYHDASLHTGNHRLHLARLAIHQGNIRLRLPPHPASTDQQTNQHTEDNIQAWHISIDKIVTQQLDLSLALAQGKIRLPSLHGSSSWPTGQALVFKLHTNNQNPQANSAEKNTETPVWHLQGSLPGSLPVESATAILNIRAEHVPLAQLRPLLPLQHASHGTVSLSGQASLHATISVQQGLWQMHGKASAQGIHLSHGGNTWQADQLQLTFGPVGMGLERQKVASMLAQHWQYTAALHPLPPPDQGQSQNPDNHADSGKNQPQPTWWATALRDNHLDIGQMAWTQGSISVGQPTSIWVDQANLTIHHIQPGQYAQISLDGQLSGGDLQLQGAWNMLSERPDFHGTASLHAATPFFLHDWMNASAMPRLMRGRLSAHLDVHNDPDRNHYRSNIALYFRQGIVEAGTFAADPMLARTGLSTADTIHQLASEHGDIKLSYQLAGSWQDQPLNLNRLGMGLQHAAITKLQHTQQPPKQKDTIPHVETRIRLHHGEPLSMNERSRIFNIIRKLRQHPTMLLDMKVEWGGSNITPDKQRRIQRTQDLIERYMAYRKIDRNRIYPLWPLPEDHTDGINAIRLETRTLK